MPNKREIAKIDKLNIISIKNISRIILKTPEILVEDIKKLIHNEKIELVHISGNLYLIEARNIPVQNIETINIELDEIVENIKILQYGYYDTPEGRARISLPDPIISQISKFIVEVNKNGNYDTDKVTLVLQNILGDIYEHTDLEEPFLDRKSIEYLAKASVSKIMKDAEVNLTEALTEILINIRKLFLAWIYDQCNICIINYETDKKEVAVIQENELIEIESKLFQKISIPYKNGNRIDILYDSTNNSLITSNFGKDKVKEVLPFIYVTVLDQIVFHIRLETFEIQKRALENIERNIIQDLNKLDPFDKTSVKDLEEMKEGLTLSSDFFCKLLNNQVNHMKSENRKIKIYYRLDYNRMLSKQLMKGPVSKSVFALTPLRDIDELDKSTLELEKMSYRFSALTGYVIQKMNTLIDAKKENNPGLFNKGLSEIREFILDFMAKYAAEVSKP